MSKSRRDLTSEEKKLWRRVAANVKARRRPLPADEPEHEPASKAAPRAARAARPTAPAVSPPKPRPVAAPVPSRGAEKRVRRGKLDIGGKLDLHGHTQETARAALTRFLHAAHARGDRTVIVITGVGRGGEGVLKRRLPDWLGSPEVRPLISGVAPAHRAHGGAGAFYVFLKRPRETEA